MAAEARKPAETVLAEVDRIEQRLLDLIRAELHGKADEMPEWPVPWSPYQTPQADQREFGKIKPNLLRYAAPRSTASAAAAHSFASVPAW